MSYYDLKKTRKNPETKKNFVGTALIDLYKAFHSIPHDLLAEKLHANGLSEDAVTFLHPYLKRRKHGVKINPFIRYIIRLYIRPHFIQ